MYAIRSYYGISGSVEGLRIAYGQPVAFFLRMESVPTKGVDQSVSLKAVNSISLVSTGSALSGMGASLMTTFFKEFSYVITSYSIHYTKLYDHFGATCRVRRAFLSLEHACRSENLRPMTYRCYRLVGGGKMSNHLENPLVQIV